MTYEHLSVSVWTILDLSRSYSRMSMNSGLPLVNNDLSLLSVWESLLSWHICLSINMYSCGYLDLADRIYPYTIHAHGLLHNYYIEHNMN